MSVRVIHSDCLEAMRAMPDASVDAIVCDPPAGIAFMGKDWDRDKGGRDAWVAWMASIAREALRVIKPGGHALVWALPRTSHWTGWAWEDGGWEPRDKIVHLFGSGFPKSLDVSKAIDKSMGENLSRQLKFTAWMRSTGISNATINAATNSAMGPHYLTDKSQPAIATADMFDLLRPHLPEVPEEIERLVAERTGIEWTAYKQRAVVGSFRSSLGGTVAAGLRDAEYIAAHRKKVVPLTTSATDAARQWQGWGTALKPASEDWWVFRKPLQGTVAANVLAHGTGAINVDGCRIPHANESDLSKHKAMVKAIKSRGGSMDNSWKNSSDLAGANDVNMAGRWPANVALDEEAAAMLDEQTSDSGGASRFFYQAKASRSERGEGNVHPTIKSIALMRWLVRLVTPPGGVVLDPFAGSGTTLLAARAEGFGAVGIEREAEYVAIIEARVAAAQKPAQRVPQRKPKRSPPPAVVAAKPSPAPDAPLPGQLALAWGA